ncbi:MAG: hypothetical protein Q9198_005605 [Flavoplaca austrocitrina]
MEARWREAVALMDGWRKRMEHTGDTINLDDLQMGMDLGAGLPEAPSPSQRFHLPPLDHETLKGDATLMEDSHEEPAITLPAVGEVDKIYDDVDGNESADQESPEPNVLRRRSGNARPSHIPHKVPFADIAEENTKAMRDFEDELILDLCNENGPTSPDKNVSSDSKKDGSPTSSPRTIQQKLEKARTEAEEARKRDEKKGKRKSGVVKKMRSSRRRSTLSPEELEKLLGIV